MLNKVFTVSRNKLLRKSGPYVGPRGGLWADSQHTVHWEPATAQSHDYGHVPSDSVAKKVEELSRLSLEELATMKQRNVQLKAVGAASKTGVSMDVMRWGIIIDKAIAKHPPKLVAAIATPKAPAQLSLELRPVGEILPLPDPKTEEPVAVVPALKPVDEFAATLEKKIEAEAKPAKKREPRTKTKEGQNRLESTGEHIWGSRVDLARLENGITDSKQLDTMNYDDAVKLVTKKNLVPAHSMESLKAMGMTPGTAHMVLAMTAAIGAKPGDSTEARAKYVDEVRLVMASMLRCKTLDDFITMKRELAQRQYATDRYEVVENREGWGFDELHERVGQLRKDHPGVEYGLRGYNIVKPALRPLDALGPRMVGFVTQQNSTLHNDAYHTALAVDGGWDQSRTGGTEALFAKAGVKDGWEYLEKRGSIATETAAAKKARVAKAREQSGAKTARGWSGAKDVSGEVSRTGAKVDVKDADPGRVKSTFGLKEVDYGQEGYMTQADREYHTKALEGALHDFAETLGLPPTSLSLKGRLGIALGARGRGKAAAHYESGRYVINMTKFAGGGSLAHEWGHALDNIIAHVYKGDKEKGVFLSDAPEASHWPEELRVAYQRVHAAMHKHPDPVKAKKDHQAAIVKLRDYESGLIKVNNALVAEHTELAAKPSAEKSVKVIARREQDIARYQREIAALKEQNKKRASFARDQEIENREYWIKTSESKLVALKSGSGIASEADTKRMAEITDLTEAGRPELNKVRDQLNTMRRLDPTVSDYRRSASLFGEYWSRPTEMFARAFESYTQDKLKKNKRTSSYLVSGTVGKVVTEMSLPSGADAQPYPQDAERENIYNAMENFIGTLSKLDQFQKALRGSLPFTRFYISGSMGA